ncbi:hypothetical protein K2173_010602 [Erythroxylum novogranatense]|uniref:Uncharacterized protein n=1 Tax=Erythroxylum novogranatense TaxID=1862640 RepID=A0AAV8TE19_9ROSI|nr:hypothetical protein K2173_010602 [Erythroxylum novogranatense]
MGQAPAAPRVISREATPTHSSDKGWKKVVPKKHPHKSVQSGAPKTQRKENPDSLFNYIARQESCPTSMPLGFSADTTQAGPSSLFPDVIRQPLQPAGPPPDLSLGHPAALVSGDSSVRALNCHPSRPPNLVDTESPLMPNDAILLQTIADAVLPTAMVEDEAVLDELANMEN